MTAIDVRPGPDAAAIAAAAAAAVHTVAANIKEFGRRYPADTTADNRYPLRPASGERPEGANYGWTTSFWPGMVWLAFELTGDQMFLAAALSHVDDFADRVERRIDLDTHDLGFLYTLSCITAWRRNRDPKAEAAALSAADHLLARFLEPAGILQAWGDLDDPRQRGRTIIDSLMNTPLLFWATEVTGDPRYADAARRHATQLSANIFRPDDTTFHTFFWDTETGQPLRGETEQGHAHDSCWSRGQAWGIYGFALNHRYTGDPAYLDAAYRCARYFLAHLPDDGVPYWDMAFTDGSGQERDSSAAAIAVCGLAELASLCPDADRAAEYRAASEHILSSLVDGYSTAKHPESNALILHGVYDKPKNTGVDEGTLWGDYFYLEALTRAARPGWAAPW